jgi:hypothetical protein
MIRAGEIAGLISLLQNRGVYLWHACQFRDFQAYLALGSIPSRACLENSGRGFTAFETDSIDHDNGVWDKVFVNLSDFGRSFAVGGNAVPNPYGPIALKIHPNALLEATDVAVCLRSAGGRQFDRNQEALKSVEEIDFLFEHPAHTSYPERSYVKFKQKLREKYPTADEPEISCTVPTGRLSIKHVVIACVDPYSFFEKRLYREIDQARSQHTAAFRVRERRCKDPSRVGLYNELASIILEGVPALQNVAQNGALSQSLRAWCQKVSKLEWQFRRFVNYLREGTLLPILKRHAQNQPTREMSRYPQSGGGAIPF